MEKYRIENIQKVVLNKREVILFNAFKYDDDQNAYIFCGQYEAPKNTDDEKLECFIND